MQITVAAGCLNQTPLDWEGNHHRIVAAIDAARGRGVQLLCLSELCVSGYGCEDLFYAPHVARTALDETHRLAEHTSGVAVVVGLPVFYNAGLYNGAALLADGRLLGITCKQHMADDGIHYEPRWFQTWPAGVAASIDAAGQSVPLGDLLFDLGGVKVGIEVCRDAWVARRPGVDLVQRGADVLLNPSASHFAFGKQATRRRLAVEASRSMGVAAVFANVLGNEAGRTVFDGGGVIASGGRVVAEGERFAMGDHTLTVAEVDLDIGRRIRTQTFAHASPANGEHGAIGAAFNWNQQSGATRQHATATAVGLPPETPTDRLKHEEFTHAVTLGLWDYLRRSGAAGFVVSLSGGADSAAVASLVHLMAARALNELGQEALLAALPRVSALRDLPAGANASDVTGVLLTCVYQATENSSQTTRDAAEQLAAALGAGFTAWSIDSLVAEYTRLAGTAIGREPAWETDDVALQNIQSRARAPGVWMLANLSGKLLLATGNRSEASVGYATMDGDSCGGLAPIGGIDKAYLLDWLRWLEVEGPAGLGPIPALAAVNRQQPTAELRPQSASQTDEADLMPYPVLSAIERAAIHDRLPPRRVLEVIGERFPDTPPGTRRRWLTRFYTLWRQNQWKRERYAPAFHLDDLNVDPRSWCRFPILSAAWERELADLDADSKSASD